MRSLARRSISPTAISDVSDASPPGSPRAVYGRLVNAVPHVHYNVDAAAVPRRSVPPTSADQKSSTVAAEVRRLLSASRSTPGGLAGRLTFSDLDRLLSHFRVDVFGADTVDDIWVSLCEVCGFKLAPAFISDASAIASVLEQFGGSAPEVKPQRSLPPRERSMSPTVSSARKNVMQQNQHQTRISPARQLHGTAVFQRLTRDAEVSRARRDDIQRSRALERDEQAASECTFTPTLRKHGRRVTQDGRSGGFDGPTQSSLSRVLAPRILDSETEDARLDAAPQIRRSLPTHVPNQVPVGYVEAVSRLRHGATERHGRQSFEESLRGPRVASERDDHLSTGTILRISVPSLGEVVHVRLASPRRR
jgi:hypothetical protein